MRGGFGSFYVTITNGLAISVAKNRYYRIEAVTDRFPSMARGFHWKRFCMQRDRPASRRVPQSLAI